jgi:hypothetical protein
MKSIWELKERMQEGADAFERERAERKERDAAYAREKAERDAEYAKMRQESAAEFDRRMAEQKAESDRQMAELRRQMKRTDKIVGNLGNHIGNMIEHMLGEQIIEKFQDLGYGVTHPVRRNCTFMNSKMGISGEFDLTLVDTDVIILISVKLALGVKEVNEHIEAMEKFRRHINAVGFVQPPFTHLLPGTRFIGAVAGGSVDNKAIDIAHENGLYTIVQSGEAVDIMKTPEGFVAKEW